MNNPFVSVLMPVYNAEKHLKEAIESILNQTYDNYEFIIINDGSIDSSEHIILSYNDPKIRYIRNNENIKLISTLNKGIRLCEGRYIVRMDADDISLPNRIEEQVMFMENNPDVAISGTWFESFGNKKGVTKYSADSNEIKYRMLFQSHLNHPTTIWRKSIIDENKLQFDPNFIHAEDYEFFARVAQNHKLSNLPKVLLKYRTHNGNISSKHRDIQIENSREIRRNLFNQTGLNPSINQIIAFEYLNYFEYKKINLSPIELSSFLNTIILANTKSKYLEEPLLIEKLSHLWYHYCLNMKHKKEFFRSNLSFRYPTSQKIKMWIKG